LSHTLVFVDISSTLNSFVDFHRKVSCSFAISDALFDTTVSRSLYVSIHFVLISFSHCAALIFFASSQDWKILPAISDQVSFLPNIDVFVGVSHSDNHFTHFIS